MSDGRSPRTARPDGGRAHDGGQSCRARRERGAAHEEPAAVDLVLDAPRRVRSIPLWRLRLVAFATPFVLLLSVGTWTMSTDEVTALASVLLRVHPLTHVSTDQPDVGVIVHAPAGDVTLVAARAGRPWHPRLLRR